MSVPHDEEAAYEAARKMDFDGLRGLVSSLLDANGWRYTVGPSEQAAASKFDPQHLRCVWHVEGGLTFTLVQPSVRWLRIGPMDVPGRFATPFRKVEFDHTNYRALIADAVAEFVKRESPEYKQKQQRAADGMSRLSALPHAEGAQLEALIASVRDEGRSIAARYGVDPIEATRSLRRAFGQRVAYSSAWDA